MAYHNRGRKRFLAEHLEARATPVQARAPQDEATGTTTFAQPTEAIALTTTFTPPSSCFENALTMLPPPGYFIWANEPVPVANQTAAACYPSEFLTSYTQVPMGKDQSSIVPVMSPFVCPKNYCTMFQERRNYIACCPSGYQFHPPNSIVDTDRPAYGGTCYSDMAANTNYPVVAYNETGDTVSQAFSTSATTVQAFAHPIDGFALTSPSMIGCPGISTISAASSSSSDSSSNSEVSRVSNAAAASSSTPADATGSSMSTGAIAGASVGGVLGLAAVVGFVWFILAYYRKHRRPPTPPPKHFHMGDEYGSSKSADAIYYRHEAEGGFTGAEIGTSGRGMPDEKGVRRNSDLNNGYGAFEMAANPPAELDVAIAAQNAKDARKGGGDPNRISTIVDKSEKERITKMANWKDYR